MNLSNHSFGTRLARPTLVVGALLASAACSHAAVILSFTGGNNAPLSVTIGGAVSYTVNAALTSNAPFFVFKNVGNALLGQRAISGNISFSINGGPNQLVSTGNSGAAIGNIAANDLYIFGPFSALVIGDVVTLSAGTVTTNTNIAGAPPSGGSFTTILTDGNGVQVATAGVAVPEPTTWALLGLGCTGWLGLRRRR